MCVLVKTAKLYADLAHTSSNRSCGCKWTAGEGDPFRRRRQGRPRDGSPQCRRFLDRGRFGQACRRGMTVALRPSALPMDHAARP
jgi:hypothetical protein